MWSGRHLPLGYSLITFKARRRLMKILSVMTGPALGCGASFSNATQRCLVAIFLGFFALQVFFTSRQLTPAYDEAAKLPVGYVFLKTGQWRIMPEHPPLIHALSALPLLALNSRLDD